MGKRFVLRALAMALVLALAALFPGGCDKPEQPAAVEPAGTGKTRVIAVAQLT